MEVHEAIKVRLSEAGDCWTVRSNMEELICFDLDKEGYTGAVGYEVSARWGASFVQGGRHVSVELYTNNNRDVNIVCYACRPSHSAAWGKRIILAQEVKISLSREYTCG